MKRHTASLVILVTLAAACSGRDAKPADSTLAQDLALASQMQSAQPQFQDTAASVATPDERGLPRAPARIESAPRTRITPRAPTATQTGSAAVAARIGAGTSLSLSSLQRVCTASNRGDRFVAVLTNPVTGSNGAVIPSGSSVILDVVASPSAASPEDAPLVLTVHSVEFNGMSYPLNGSATAESNLERQRLMSDPNADKKKVAGGAIAGAILGQMIGKNTKGTVIGAAAGAATGAVIAKRGEKFENCLPSGGALRVTLNQDVVL